MSAAEHQTASTTEAQKPGYKPIDEEAFEMKTGSDLGKAALFVALLAVILMVVLYFSQQQNFTGMAAQLDEVQGVKQELEAVQGQMTALEGEMEALVESLKDLPQEARRVVITSMLTESASKINFLSTQVETQDQQAKLQEIQKMIEALQADM
ncbi:MAG: hypothetical protein EA399_02935 [Desulfovibrionales bacterium]|nr:MAG: hypothetical protein EA399_02935 [Desulfovibrionales bacterium]